MGYLLANVAFDTGISAQMADQIIKAAEQLTYRQLCILKLTAEKNSFRLRTQNYREHDSFPRELIQVLYECLDLYIRGFINFGEGGLSDLQILNQVKWLFRDLVWNSLI